jgi:RecA/RadA recombinase
MKKDADKKVDDTKKAPVKKLNLDAIVAMAQNAYGKDKSLASKISTGKSISRPKADEDFIMWPDSPWSTLTGIKGLPFGYICQVAGKPDSGKSTMAAEFMSRAQQQGVVVILWDAENKFSAKRFDTHFGGSSEDILITTSKMILEGADQVEKLVHAIKEQDPQSKILIVWDSVGGTLAKNEGENSLLEGKQLASAPKDNGQAMRAFVRLMEQYKDKVNNKEQIAVFLINQLYANIGSVGSTESGGVKVQYYSSIILQLSRKSDLNKIQKGTKIKTGIVSRAKVKKNHLFDGEFSVAELDIVVSAAGISLLSEKKIKKDDSKQSSGWDDNSSEDLIEESSDEDDKETPGI